MSWKPWIAGAFVSCSIVAAADGKPADLPVDLRINLAAAADAVGADDAPTAPDDERAVDLFRQAERHRRLGQLSEARRAYQEVHLLSPASRVGRDAMSRIRELEAPGNDFYEEQEPPLSRSSYRPAAEPRRDVNRVKPSREEYEEMLRQTQPLETTPAVPRSY